MEIDDWPNLPALLLSQAEKCGDRPFLWEKRDGKYTAMSWGEVAGQVGSLAAALQSYGLARGDRVLLLSQNSPRWAIADFAIMAAGGVTVPMYTTNTVSNHEHILSDSGVRESCTPNRRVATIGSEMLSYRAVVIIALALMANHLGA